MVKALVVFGSKSDDGVVLPLVKELEASGVTCTVEYASAHRQPDRLEETLRTVEFDCIVAGAGLAAHLPGVAASKTLKPVIGIPVAGAFCGFDAWMSIVQMPPGIPVFTAVPRVALAPGKKSNAKASLAWKPFVEAVGGALPIHWVGSIKNIESTQARKARAILNAAVGESGWTAGPQLKPGAYNIVFCPNGKWPASVRKKKGALLVQVPWFENEKLQDVRSSIQWWKAAHHLGGLWFGANNFVNAVCGGLQLSNGDGRYNLLLTQVKKGEFRE